MLNFKKLLAGMICMIFAATITAGCAESSTADNTNPQPTEKETKQHYVLVEARNYWAGGTLCGTHQFTYDSQGRLISDTYDTTLGASHCYHHTYSYNSRGYLYKKTVVGSEPLQYEDYAYTYNDDGTVASCESSDTRWLFTYDDQGRMLKMDSERKPFSSHQNYADCEYDENGRLISIEYTSSPEKWEFCRFSYDEQSNMIRMAAGHIYQRCDRRHSGDCTAQCPITRYEEYPFNYAYQYDEAGRLAPVYATNGPIIDFAYTVDEHGNITEVRKADGSRKEFRYEAIELSEEDAELATPCWNVFMMRLGIVDYIDQIEGYFLPRINLQNFYID